MVGIVAEHAQAFDRDHVIYDWRHYLPLIERKPDALCNGAPFSDLLEPLQRLSKAASRLMLSMNAKVCVRRWMPNLL
ncbi:MAG: Fused ISPsy20 transposase/transcriptional regulator LysR family protein [Nevskia sp.]|nr:Fused ISPsy20 transposase/transcriptional regulator LysR family protein [Nevskia sp.]